MPDFAHFYPSNWRSWASLSSPQRGSLRKQRHKRDSLARSAFGFAKCNRWRAFLIARSARRAHLADSFALRPEALRGDPAPLRCELRFPSPCFSRSLSLSRERASGLARAGEGSIHTIADLHFNRWLGLLRARP